MNNLVIDNQHKKLFEITNNLILQSNAKVYSEIINKTLSELLQYTKYHFHAEEELLEKRNYPKLDEHRKAHNEFIYKITFFCKDVVDEKSSVVEELLDFLVAWLLQHLTIDDQDYKNYM